MFTSDIVNSFHAASGSQMFVISLAAEFFIHYNLFCWYFITIIHFILDLIQFSTKIFATMSVSCQFTSTRKINLQIFGIEL